MNKLNKIHCTRVPSAENLGTKQIKFILMKINFKNSYLISKKLQDFCD